MNNYLKTYDITLTVKGPVFVGDGKQIGKKEYVFLSNNEVGVLNIEKLYSELRKRGKAQGFERYMLENGRDNLNDWLRSQNLTVSDIRHCIKYDLESCDVINRRAKGLQVMSFIKDPYGNPYIPGTSLKGMFRTMFLSEEITHNKSRYNDAAKKIKDASHINDNKPANGKSLFQKEVKDIETVTFNTLGRDGKKEDARNDIMQGFIVSDSEPLSVDDLVLCQKIEVHRDNSEKSLPILRESLKPGTKVRFKVTVDTSKCSYDEIYILNAIKNFNMIYYDSFLNKFNRKMPSDKTVYLGGGVGFVSKTIIYPLFEQRGLDITSYILNKTVKGNKNRNDIKIGVSPHVLKCTHYKNRLYQFGECELEIMYW